MTQKLALHRAARIVGVTRGVLQQKIKDGELRASDGLISTDDLLAAYPDTKFEEDLVVEHLERLKDESFAKRVREHVLPSQEVLAARLYEQSRELADLRNHLQRYHAVVIEMQARLRVLDATSSGALEALSHWLDARLEDVLNTEDPDPLSVLDDYLRVVSAQIVLRPSGHEFFVEGSDTILEAALRAGLAINYGCSNGNCGLCKARVVSGQVAKVRHHDYVLSEAEKNQGYTLTCSYAAVTDLVIEALEARGPSDIPLQEVQTRVKTVQSLGPGLRLVHLQTPRVNRLRFLAGQRAALSIQAGAASEYSIASCPCDDRNLQFHIREDTARDFERHVFADLKSGDNVMLRGPFGHFVLDEESAQPLIFIAGEHGFAPIKSLIEHAMALDNAERLRLIRFADGDEALYQANLCRSWSDALDNFSYFEFIVQPAQDLLEAALMGFPLERAAVYVAGPQAFIDTTRALLADYPQIASAHFETV